MIGFAVPLLVLLAVVLAVVAVVQRMMGKATARPGAGADVIAYLLLALTMGVAGFAIADLASTAFPGDRFVFDPAAELATSLAALVVSVPFALFFWRRQERRRVAYPGAVGWTLYLALMQLLFLIAFVVSTVQLLDGLFTGGNLASWTGSLVFGAVVVFHEMAAARTPPRSDAGELPRVLGAAIGWVTAVVGLAGTLGLGVLAALYRSVADETVEPEWSPWLAMALVGVAIWAYNWVRPWREEAGAPRVAWTTLVSTVSLAATLGWAIAIGVLFIQYLFSDPLPAGRHFEPFPTFAGIALVGFASWAWHRRQLDGERTNSLRSYEYAMSGLSLSASTALLVTLTITVLEGDLIVGGGPDTVMSLAFSLLVALGVWRYFDSRWKRGAPEFEATAWPRRIHNLGLGIVFGLVAAGSLITTIFILLRRLLDGNGGDSLLTPVSILIYTGLAGWYLLAAYARDREYVEEEQVVTPFDVTIVTSHPGGVATRFPKQAKLTVIHRGDDLGAIDDEMADAIVAAVANRSSLVWVDEDGFRVAPKRLT